MALVGLLASRSRQVAFSNPELSLAPSKVHSVVRPNSGPISIQVQGRYFELGQTFNILTTEPSLSVSVNWRASWRSLFGTGNYSSPVLRHSSHYGNLYHIVNFFGPHSAYSHHWPYSPMSVWSQFLGIAPSFQLCIHFGHISSDISMAPQRSGSSTFLSLGKKYYSRARCRPRSPASHLSINGATQPRERKTFFHLRMPLNLELY